MHTQHNQLSFFYLLHVGVDISKDNNSGLYI